VRIGSVVVVFIFLGWIGVTINIGNRYENLFVEGTSSYYRLTAITMLLSDSIPEFPLGHPLGQTDYIEKMPYMINWEYGSTTNIDNSFFMVSYYFGILGIIVALIVLAYAVYLILKHSYAALIMVTLLLSLAETGGLWSPNVVLLVGYSIILIRFIRSTEHQLEVRRIKGIR
jgi:hypothetical protein